MQAFVASDGSKFWAVNTHDRNFKKGRKPRFLMGYSSGVAAPKAPRHYYGRRPVRERKPHGHRQRKAAVMSMLDQLHRMVRKNTETSLTISRSGSMFLNADDLHPVRLARCKTQALLIISTDVSPERRPCHRRAPKQALHPGISLATVAGETVTQISICICYRISLRPARKFVRLSFYRRPLVQRKICLFDSHTHAWAGNAVKTHP